MRRPRGRDVAAARLLGASLVLVGLAACSTRAPVDPLAAVEPRRAAVEALIRCGSHDCLTRSLGLAQELHRRLPERADVRDDAVRAALLLGHGARAERRLGVAEAHYRSAFQALPRSVAAGMSLADLSFLPRGLAPGTERLRAGDDGGARTPPGPPASGSSSSDPSA